MKINIVSLLFMVSSFFYFSCTKPHSDGFTVLEYQSSIKSCVCAGNSDKEQFRFEAVINSEHVCFDRLWYPYYTSLDLWMKTWRDAIYTERINADSTIAIRMEYDNPPLNNFPYHIL